MAYEMILYEVAAESATSPATRFGQAAADEVISACVLIGSEPFFVGLNCRDRFTIPAIRYMINEIN
jgi:hypothetical protein